MADHSHYWYDEATTKERINDSLDNIDTQKLKENIHAIQASFKNYEGAHLTKECPLKKEDKMDNGCDITIKDVEKLWKMLTPTIHTLPNLEPVEQPCMPLSRFCDKTIVVREDEQNNDIPLQDGVMRPLTPQTAHIIPPDDVAPATSLILDKHLKDFKE
ncbi:hypothetical protein Tco_0349664 [Tanacetum coccineum]